MRVLGIPTVSDRVAQTAVKMSLEPRLDPIFHRNSYGYRPGKSALEAIAVTRRRCWDQDWVVEFDIRGLFDNVRHDRLLAKVAQRVDDADVMHLLKIILKACGKQGVPQGGVISPLLSNIYLTEVDRMLERAKEALA